MALTKDTVFRNSQKVARKPRFSEKFTFSTDIHCGLPSSENFICICEKGKIRLLRCIHEMVSLVMFAWKEWPFSPDEFWLRAH